MFSQGRGDIGLWNFIFSGYRGPCALELLVYVLAGLRGSWTSEPYLFGGRGGLRLWNFTVLRGKGALAHWYFTTFFKGRGSLVLWNFTFFFGVEGRCALELHVFDV